MKAARCARICAYAAVLSLGRLLEAEWHTGVAYEAVWFGIWLLAAAAFDFYAWNSQ